MIKLFFSFSFKKWTIWYNHCMQNPLSVDLWMGNGGFVNYLRLPWYSRIAQVLGRDLQGWGFQSYPWLIVCADCKFCVVFLTAILISCHGPKTCTWVKWCLYCPMCVILYITCPVLERTVGALCPCALFMEHEQVDGSHVTNEQVNKKNIQTLS